MSFASLNGVTAGGMAGSFRAPRPTASSWVNPAIAPAPPPPPQVDNVKQYGGTQNIPGVPISGNAPSGGGMLGTKSQGGAAQYIMNPTGEMGPAGDSFNKAKGSGAVGVITNPENPLVGGVVAGNQGPQLQQPAAGPAFDPNDPNNAALAGYMRG